MTLHMCTMQPMTNQQQQAFKDVKNMCHLLLPGIANCEYWRTKFIIRWTEYGVVFLYCRPVGHMVDDDAVHSVVAYANIY